MLMLFFGRKQMSKKMLERALFLQQKSCSHLCEESLLRKANIFIL